MLLKNVNYVIFKHENIKNYNLKSILTLNCNTAYCRRGLDFLSPLSCVCVRAHLLCVFLHVFTSETCVVWYSCSCSWKPQFGPTKERTALTAERHSSQLQCVTVIRQATTMVVLRDTPARLEQQKRHGQFGYCHNFFFFSFYCYQLQNRMTIQGKRYVTCENS